MAKVELNVAEPKAFESGANVARALMTYGDTGAPIVIDTDTALIECEGQGKSAPVTQWMVDFDSHKMKLADDAAAGSYHEIDFSTAMGMVGQLVMEVGQRTLLTLLNTLRVAYVDDGSGRENPAPESSGTDVPTEGLPESAKDPAPAPSKEPDLPDPVNLDV